MENIVKIVTNNESYFDLDDNNKFKGKMPKTFSMSDFPKLKPTANSKYRLRNFKGTVIIKSLDPALYPTVFPRSLDTACQN